VSADILGQMDKEFPIVLTPAVIAIRDSAAYRAHGSDAATTKSSIRIGQTKGGAYSCAGGALPGFRGGIRVGEPRR
jgi:hypothetical protein